MQATPTYSQLQAQIADLTAQAAETLKKERQEAMDTIASLMGNLKISFDDLRRAMKVGGKKTPAQQAVAKYKDTASDKTWNGRGRRPHWMVKDPEHYLIEKN